MEQRLNKHIIIFEIIAVLLTGAFKFILVDLLEAKFWFIFIFGLLWIIYIVARAIQSTSILKDWGFKREGFIPSIKIILLPALVVLIVSIGYGLSKDHLILNWHIIPIMILYPIWGTIQQFLIISLFGGNLNRINTLTILNIILTAFLFSMVHYPSLLLIVATFFMAIFYMLLFLRYKNLWALGLFHGWLAGFFYFFVLGRDPWVEFIGSI